MKPKKEKAKRKIVVVERLEESRAIYSSSSASASTASASQLPDLQYPYELTI